MHILVEIPDSAAGLFEDQKSISRELLEAYAIRAYQAEGLTRRQVGLLLGLDRWQTEQFLTERNALRPFDAEDFELERPTLESLS